MLSILVSLISKERVTIVETGWQVPDLVHELAKAIGDPSGHPDVDEITKLVEWWVRDDMMTVASIAAVDDTFGAMQNVENLQRFVGLHLAPTAPAIDLDEGELNGALNGKIGSLTTETWKSCKEIEILTHLGQFDPFDVIFDSLRVIFD